MIDATAIRPAATLLLLRDDPFEVLMVRRSTAGSYASAMVFPGGAVDPADADESWLSLVDGAEGFAPEERALRIAALRETWEEAGILLAVDRDGSAIAGMVSCDTRDFRSAVAASEARLPLGALVRFANWITPEGAARRWDTHFYIARAPGGQVARCDDVETTAPEWLSPRAALALFEAGERRIVPPTRANLHRLAESADCDAALAAARARPPFAVHPRFERRGEDHVTIIPPEAGYGFTELPLAALG